MIAYTNAKFNESIDLCDHHNDQIVYAYVAFFLPVTNKKSEFIRNPHQIAIFTISLLSSMDFTNPIESIWNHQNQPEMSTFSGFNTHENASSLFVWSD